MLIPVLHLFKHSGSDADVSEAYSASIFRVEVRCNMYSGNCAKIHMMQRHKSRIKHPKIFSLYKNSKNVDKWNQMHLLENRMLEIRG
jgi:hypothetical protein